MSKVNKELFNKVIENIELGSRGILTGLDQLDSVLGGGMQDGYLYLLGARPAMGKTALALNIVCHAIENGIKVTYYSLDMNKEKLIERLLYMLAKIPFPKPDSSLCEEEKNKLIAASEKIYQAEFVVNDRRISVDEIYWKKECEPDYEDSQLIIVDYLQLLSTHILKENRDNDNIQNEMEYICKSLKDLARDANVPVLVLSQLSRACERRLDHRPILSDFRESAAIEEVADAVMFLYRDDYYNLDSELKCIAEVNVAKNKTGYCRNTKFAYIAEYTKFCNIRKL